MTLLAAYGFIPGTKRPMAAQETRKDNGVTALNLKAGDKVRLDWRRDWTSGQKTGVVIDHPVRPDWVIVVSTDTSVGAHGAWVYNRNGIETGCTTSDISLIDPIREEWDALDENVRRLIGITAYNLNRKILAIKELRRITGWSLVDAKRAVEELADMAQDVYVAVEGR